MLLLCRPFELRHAEGMSHLNREKQEKQRLVLEIGQMNLAYGDIGTHRTVQNERECHAEH